MGTVNLHRNVNRGLALLIATLVLVAGCSKSGTEALPAKGVNSTTNYQGPAPANADVQSFKLNVWDNLGASNRCSTCHSSDAAQPQAPYFAERSDVNQAYTAALALMDRDHPEDSRLVTKVGAGHNCWEASAEACAEIMTRWINAWAGGEGGVSGRQIMLTSPTNLRAPGASLNFPDDNGALFSATVYPLLTGDGNCVRCHRESAATPQAPFFASADLATAYEAAKNKIDLNNPELSRLVVRLRQEFHNCWSGDCAADADEMEDAIRQLADGATSDAPADNLVTSRALTLHEGVVASGGARHEANLIALWEFKTGSGNVAYDTSGIAPALNLTLSGNVSWVGGWGIQLTGGKAQGSTTASQKLRDLIVATGEYSIEGWVVPANVTQEEARIISYSAGTTARNFTLAQTLYNYNYANRSRDSDRNGMPALSTADADRALQASLQHVVATFDPVNGRRIYVNGELKASGGVTDGSLADWDDTYAFVLGNEVSGNRPWSGTLRMVAIHNRALTEAQIQQNFRTGVGEKFFLLFNVGDQVEPVRRDASHPNHHYILFEVSQYDSYSYLFYRPIFVSLESDYVPNFPLETLRIGINGKEALAGQAYAPISTQVTADNQVLSDLGTIIALERGAQADEFFLSFGRIGTCGACTNVVVEAIPPPAPAPSPAVVADIGVRTFGEIDATLSAITGIARTNATVAATYTKYEQQLPSAENIETFLASHQMAVAQLTMSYCNALVEKDRVLASADAGRFFAGFDFTRSAGTAFDATGKAQILDPLLHAAMNADGTVPADDLATQPDTTAVRDLLSASSAQDLDAGLAGDSYQSLITEMSSCLPGCDTTARTAEIVKATCSAVLGSAVMLIQ